MTRPPFVFIGGTSEPGGLHVHTADVAMAATQAGHAVSIVCPSIDHFSAMFAGTSVRVEIVPPKTPGESERRYWSRVLAHHRRAHAVLCRGKLGESTINDLIGIRLATRRLFTIEHRAIENPALSARDLHRHGWAMRATVRRVIAVSDEIAASAVHDLGLPASMVAPCINWYDPTFIAVTAEQRRAAKHALGLDPEALIIGYHGRLAPEKRIPMLIDAFAELAAPPGRNLHLVLVGEGWKRRELEERIRERGIATRCLITGWHPDPRAALAAFDVSVLPSLSEGFPLGLLEAMATGAACLAHPMSSTRAIIDDGRTGFLADLNEAADFATALRRLVTMSDIKREALGRAAAASMVNHFSRAARLPAVLHALGITIDPYHLPDRTRCLEFVR
jgi:glycosyltransferase involved in cell wall biosynthesis